MTSLTEAAKAVLQGQSLQEGATLPTPGPVTGGQVSVKTHKPDSTGGFDPSTASTGNAKTLHPGTKYKEDRRRPQNGAGAADNADFEGQQQDLGGQTPTSLPSGNLGAAAASAVGKDSTRSGKPATAGDRTRPQQGTPEKAFKSTMAEDEEIEGDLVSEEEYSDELEAFVAEAIEAGLSEEEIEELVAENFTFEDESTVEYDVDMSEHVEALLAGENLSEEFKSKASTIFEAAVKSKLEEEVALLEQAYAETLEERVAEIQEQLASDVDDYLNYVVEQWIEENEVAVESALRSELTEDFISGLRSLFAEHYIDVPEEKVSVVEELSSTVEELEEKLNEEIERNVALTSALNESRRFDLIDAVCEGLTTTQAEKLRGLVENVNYTNDEEFIEKISTLRENYFPAAVKTDEVLDRVESKDPSMISESTLEGPMAKYVTALGRSLPK
jgi:hypothetical protein